MNKEDVVHIHNGILAIEKSEIMPLAATWIHLEIIMPSEVSQKEKDRDFPGGPVVKTPRQGA